MIAENVRIGLASFAHMHAASYAACLRQLDNVEIVGLYDDHADRGAGQAQRFETPFVADLDTLLDQDLDGLIICSENSRHRPMVERAAGRTRHILCEKPIATTVVDARSMIDTCRSRGTRLQIAFPVRFAPGVQQLKELIDGGELGRVYAVKCTNHGSLPGGWFMDRALSGGGAVIDHTVHVVDLLRWIWNTEVVEIYAEVGVGLTRPDLDIDDAGLLSFTLANGIYGTLDTSWSRPTSYPTWGDVKIEVVAEGGVVYLDAFAQAVTVASNQIGKTRWQGWGSNMDMGLIRDFVEMIRGGREPSISGEDGLQALAVALAAYRSAETGQPVVLSSITE